MLLSLQDADREIDHVCVCLSCRRNAVTFDVAVDGFSLGIRSTGVGDGLVLVGASSLITDVDRVVRTAPKLEEGGANDGVVGQDDRVDRVRECQEGFRQLSLTTKGFPDF